MTDLAGLDLGAPSGYVPFPGVGDSFRRQLIAEPLPGGGGVVTIPGPAAGYVRHLDTLILTADTLAAALASVSVTLQPLGMQVTPTLAGTSATSRLPILQSGESIDVVNAGANPGSVALTYFDVPSLGYGFARFGLTAGLKTFIPAPAVGLYNRPVFALVVNSTTVSQIEPRFNWQNRDTVGHTVELVSNGIIVGRSATSAAGASFVSLTGALQAYATAALGPLQVRLNAAPATNEPGFFGAYRTSVT